MGTFHFKPAGLFFFFKGFHLGSKPEVRPRGSIQIETSLEIILQPNSQCQIGLFSFSFFYNGGKEWKWRRWPHYLSLSLCANRVQSDLCHESNGVSLTHSWQGASCRERRRLTCNWWMPPLHSLLSFRADACWIQRVALSRTCAALPWPRAALSANGKKKKTLGFLFFTSVITSEERCVKVKS